MDEYTWTPAEGLTDVSPGAGRFGTPVPGFGPATPVEESRAYVARDGGVLREYAYPGTPPE